MFLPLFESGDEIVEVNSQNIRGYSHNEAIRIFKAAHGIVQLRVKRVKRRLSNASKQSTSRMSAPDMPSNPASDDGYHVFDVGLVKGKFVCFYVFVYC